MGYLGENAVRYFGKKTKKYFANQTISSGTTLSNNYEIQLPLTYVVGNNSLELFWNGAKLIKSDGIHDGHYIEYGTSGSTSNKIKIHRTYADGSYVLPHDVILESYVKGVDQE